MQLWLLMIDGIQPAINKSQRDLNRALSRKAKQATTQANAAAATRAKHRKEAGAIACKGKQLEKAAAKLQAAKEHLLGRQHGAVDKVEEGLRMAQEVINLTDEVIDLTSE